MQRQTPPAATGPRRRTDLLACLAVSLLGPLLAFRDMLAGGLAGVPGDAHDGRTVALFIEHSWLWLSRHPGHRALWDLPFFYPAGDNALAYGDALVSFGPFYWPWRAAGLPPDTSFQLWVLSVMAASAAAAYVLLRALRLPPWVAIWGAWVVTFAASRLHHVSHPQLLPLVYVLAGLTGLVGYATAATPRGRRGAAAVLVAAGVLQLYGGVYNAFFLALAGGLLGLVTVAVPALRRPLLSRLRHDAGWWLLVGALGAAALVPWWRHYTAAAAAVGERSWSEVAPHLPRPQSWLLVSNSAVAYRGLAQWPLFASLPRRFEQAISPGWLALAATLLAGIAGRRDRRVQLAVAVAALLVGLTTLWPGGWTAWRAVVAVAPPVAAIRAIQRVGMLLPLAVAVIVGVWLADAGRRPRWRWIGMGIALLLAAEQLATPRLHDKQAQRHWLVVLHRELDPAAPAFYVARHRPHPEAHVVQVDAMWLALLSGVPTVNGHSSVLPPGWLSLRWTVPPDTATRTARERLAQWLAASGGDPRTQVILLPEGYRRRVGAPRPPRRRGPATPRPSRPPRSGRAPAGPAA